MKILAKRIKKNDEECHPFESGWVTVVVSGVNLDEDNVAEFLYNNGVNMDNKWNVAPGQYYQHVYFSANPHRTRACVKINFGYDV